MVQIEETRHLPTTVKDVATDEGKTAVVDAKLSLGATIEGRVLGSDGKPCAGATVALDWRPEEDAGQQGWNAGGRNRVTSDSDGKFRAEGLKPGRYGVRAESRGFAPSESVQVVADSGPVTLRLQGALRIGGVVRVGGAPVARVEIGVMRRNRGDGAGGGVSAASSAGGNTESWEQAASMESDGEGRFLFEDLPAGSYRLTFAPPSWGEGRANVQKKTVEDVAAGNEALVVDLEGGLAIGGTVTLEDGTPAANGWINAIPVSADGKPVPGASNVWGSFDGGRFELVGLAPGTYDVNVNVQGRGNKRVRVEAGRNDLAIVIGVGCRITGKVVLEDGSAAANVWVHASNAEGGQGAATDVEGRYTIAGLDPGTYRIDARVMGAQPGAHGVIDQIATRANDTVEAPQITVHPQPATEEK
jgi:protocatechuate 3,4-dioxygenase beta subunit